MVGVGPELDNYKSIAKEANVDDKVIFYGEINEGLDEIYEKFETERRNAIKQKEQNK